MARSLRRVQRRDDGVHEVVGYTLMFGIGAVAVTLALNTFLTAKEASDGLATFAELNQVADLVANEATRVSQMASAAPNATYTVYMTLPEGPAGATYNVTLTKQKVWVGSKDIDFVLNRTLPRLNQVTVFGLPMQIQGTVQSNQGVVAIEYAIVGGQPTIRLKNA